MSIIIDLFGNKILRFIFSGGIAFISHISILFVLVHYFNLWYLVSTMIAFTFAVTVSYSLQKFFTFQNYSTKNMHRQFLSFLFFALCMLGLNTLLMYIFVDIIGFWYISSQIVINIFTAFFSYIIYNKVIFSKKV